jgi:SAM-dependent methyltransferase
MRPGRASTRTRGQRLSHGHRSRHLLDAVTYDALEAIIRGCALHQGTRVPSWRIGPHGTQRRMSQRFPGTDGYEEHAAHLVARYEAIAFEDKYGRVIHLTPAPPAAVLDIGAGTGADAAWLAVRGHRVVAVEPVSAFRQAGRDLHADPSIEWLDDGLPQLESVVARRERFDLILLTAVWMHLAREVRELAMPVVASLLRPGGVLLLSLRHGPVPRGRRMYDVTAHETTELARACGLSLLVAERVASCQPGNKAAGVEWSQLAFRRATAAWHAT